MDDRNLHNRKWITRINVFPVLFATFILMHLVLIWSVRIYPFVDVPNHLGLATIYRYYGEPNNLFSYFYTINTFLKPNTFHIQFCGSSIFPTVEVGNKVFFCLYVILLPVSILFTIKKLGGNPWLAFLSFLYLYNYNVSFGFVGFSIAIPFVFMLFAKIPDHLEKDNLLTFVLLSGLFVLLFFMHALAVLFALLIFISCTLYHNRHSLVHVCRKSMIVIPVAILMMLWWLEDTKQFSGPGFMQFLFDYYKQEYFQKIELRGGLLIFDNYALFEGFWGYTVAIGFSVFVLVLVLWGISSRSKSISSFLLDKKVKLILIFITCSFCCFLFMPLSLPGYGYLIQRFPVFVFLAIIIFGSVVAPRILNRKVIIAICLVAFLHFVCWFDYFKDFDKENELFSQDFFPATENGRPMASLIYDCNFRGRPIYRQCLDYYIVWRQGIATTRLVDDRSFAVRRRVDKNMLPSFIPDYHPYDESELHGIDYILIREKVPAKVKETLNKYDLERTAGKWAIYKKKND